MFSLCKTWTYSWLYPVPFQGKISQIISQRIIHKNILRFDKENHHKIIGRTQCPERGGRNCERKTHRLNRGRASRSKRRRNYQFLYLRPMWKKIRPSRNNSRYRHVQMRRYCKEGWNLELLKQLSKARTYRFALACFIVETGKPGILWTLYKSVHHARKTL